MPRIVFPYILTLSVLLFVLGLYNGVARPGERGVRSGVLLACAGVAVGALGFIRFLPEYFLKPSAGYGIILCALAGMAWGSRGKM